ncbi:MAG: TetR/AcrR family transcriptional regulator [Thermoanaerobaculia bacterium]
MGRTPRVTREEVLSAARETFVERGYEGATLAAIGAKLGVSAAALLRHAPTKRDLFIACMGEGEAEMTPLAFLDDLDGSEDPRRVLRRAAETMIPFLESKIRQVIARFVYFKTVPGIGPMPLPFDPSARPTPPQKNLKFLENYMRRAARRGRLRVESPRAAAMAFLANIHSYVFLQHVIPVLDEPLPLEEYLDTVLDVWTRGAVVRGRKGKTP